MDIKSKQKLWIEIELRSIPILTVCYQFSLGGFSLSLLTVSSKFSSTLHCSHILIRHNIYARFYPPSETL